MTTDLDPEMFADPLPLFTPRPKRIQLSRRKGFRLPLNAKSVARPSRWGNPFRIKGVYVIEPGGFAHYCQPGEQRGVAARLFSEAIREDRLEYAGYPTLAVVRRDLAGFALACYCPLAGPCHADVLLELANQGESL